MSRYSRDPDDLNYGARFERDLDISDEREPFRARVAIKRVATAPADQLERIALKCSAAFVKADEDHPDYDTTAEREMDVQS